MILSNHNNSNHSNYSDYSNCSDYSTYCKYHTCATLDCYEIAHLAGYCTNCMEKLKEKYSGIY